MSEQVFNPAARAARAHRISVWRWVLWYAALAGGMLIFYVLLTPLWMGLRGLAWLAELRARRHRSAA